MYWKRGDGGGAPERLTTVSALAVWPYSWTPDGKTLLYLEHPADTGYDIWLVSLEGEGTSQPVLQTRFNESNPAISPDGRWIAYQSDESGRYEVYVQPFPDLDGKWQVSTDGGLGALWAPDGGELFYRKGNAMMVASIDTEPTFTHGTPEVLFEGSYYN